MSTTNGSSYADLNPSANYGEYEPNFSGNGNFSASDNFSSYNTTQDNKNRRSGSYYCNGNTGLAEKTSRVKSTSVMKEFFGEKNIKRIQEKIRREIYERSGRQFKMDVDQDQEKLHVAMEDTYSNYSKNLPNHVRSQTKKLNEKLVDNLVPNMLTAIKQYYGYMKDISTPIEPMSRPINVNNAGRQTLPSVTTIWEDLGSSRI
jgi:hypothetical protein